MCMHVSEICAEGIFVSFPWWLKKLKNSSKIALFSNERHFEIWFPKKKTITYFGRKLSKLHKRQTILHVTITFSLKQGETRASSGPIPLPLRGKGTQNQNLACFVCYLQIISTIFKTNTCIIEEIVWETQKWY